MTNLWGGLSSNQMKLLSDTKQYHQDLQSKISSGEIPATGTVKPKQDSAESGGLANENMMNLMMMLMMTQFMSMFQNQSQSSQQYQQVQQQQTYQPSQPWYAAPFNAVQNWIQPYWPF